MADQWRPDHYRVPGEGPEQPTARTYLGTRLIAALGVLVLGAVAIVSGLVVFGSDSSAFEVVERPFPDPIFEPMYEEGADPFYSLSKQIRDARRTSNITPTPEAIASGQFGGDAEATCDPQRLIDHLMQP